MPRPLAYPGRSRLDRRTGCWESLVLRGECHPLVINPYPACTCNCESSGTRQGVPDPRPMILCRGNRSCSRLRDIGVTHSVHRNGIGGDAHVSSILYLDKSMILLA